MKAIESKFVVQPEIYFNKESMQHLRTITGTKAFVVSDSIIEKLGYLKQIVDYLKDGNMEVRVFTDVRPDPDVKVVAKGMEAYLEDQVNVLVAIGGGSVIDTAKAILYTARQYEESHGRVMEKPLFIAIPSTSGTGSEVTDFSVITVEDEKICIVDDYICPDIAILDSTCIRHVPGKVVVDTGIDVLVHAIEAYVSTNATDFTDALAEKAVQLIFEHLKTLYQDPGDSYARDRVQNASCMAGMAFTNAGLGVTHSLAHALGGSFHIPHGRANALLLNKVMEYNANLGGGLNEEVCKKLSALASMLNLPARTIREGTVSFMEGVENLKRDLGIEHQIRNLGIDKSQFEELAEQMAETALRDRCTPTNPRKPTKEEMIQIYLDAF